MTLNELSFKTGKRVPLCPFVCRKGNFWFSYNNLLVGVVILVLSEGSTGN